MFVTQYYHQLRKTLQKIFPCINTFYREGTTMVNAMRDLTVGIFEHIEIIFMFDIDQSIEYTQRILGKTK